MSSEVLIEVDKLGKFYYKGINSAKIFLGLLFGIEPSENTEKFWATRNVSFKLHKGEALGIIGRNGGGKSTLLQLVCGTLEPNEGAIKINGRVAGILELGAGFNPEFSGIENIKLNARILGLSPEEVDNKLNDIINFADIGDYVYSPLKTYSSGMVVRLAFAIVANVSADILIIDEALAVGDVLFQQKCLRFLEVFKQNGGGILFVSHDTSVVSSFCENVVYLKRADENYQATVGPAKDICNQYMSDLYSDVDKSVGKPVAGVSHKASHVMSSSQPHVSKAGISKSIITVSDWNKTAERFGLQPDAILDAIFLDESNAVLTQFESDVLVTLKVWIEVVRPLVKPSLTFMLKDRSGRVLFSDCSLNFFENSILASKRCFEVALECCFPNLVTGDYSFDFALADGSMQDHVQISWIHDGLIVSSSNKVNVVGSAGFSSAKMIWQ